MTHLSNIERDLSINATDRLKTWMRDTKMRCDIVDMPAQDQIGLVATCLIERLISLFRTLDITPQQAGQLIHDMMKGIDEYEERSK